MLCTLMHVYLHVGVTLVRHYTVAMHTHTHTHTYYYYYYYLFDKINVRVPILVACICKSIVRTDTACTTYVTEVHMYLISWGPTVLATCTLRLQK